MALGKNLFFSRILSLESQHGPDSLGIATAVPNGEAHGRDGLNIECWPLYLLHSKVPCLVGAFYAVIAVGRPVAVGFPTGTCRAECPSHLVEVDFADRGVEYGYVVNESLGQTAIFFMTFRLSDVGRGTSFEWETEP